MRRRYNQRSVPVGANLRAVPVQCPVQSLRITLLQGIYDNHVAWELYDFMNVTSQRELVKAIKMKGPALTLHFHSDKLLFLLLFFLIRVLMLP